MRRIVLFDNACNLCNSSISFIKNYDSEEQFELVPLQSELGQSILKKYKLSTDSFDTVVLIEDETVHVASTAILKILKNLSGYVKYLYLFIFIPRVIRDSVYKLIAKNRHILFNNTCSLPKK